MNSLVVPDRFNGPAESANGGYVAGRLASFLPADAVVTVTLRQPPPLETEMVVEVTDTSAELWRDGLFIAEAVIAPPSELGDAVPPVDESTARAAMSRFDGMADHPYPTCFVCGTARDDNLRVHAGRPDGGAAGTTAAVFEPRTDLVMVGTAQPALVGPEFVWAALDCPGGWSIGLPGRPAVLGRMTAHVAGLPAVGETCVVVGALDRWEGRKAFTRTSLYNGEGHEVGRASAVWIELAR